MKNPYEHFSDRTDQCVAAWLHINKQYYQRLRRDYVRAEKDGELPVQSKRVEAFLCALIKLDEASLLNDYLKALA